MKHGYTLVQHSGYVHASKPDFKHAVELKGIVTQRELDDIEKVGGLVLPTYQTASDREEAENYPPEVQGLIPKIRGTFANRSINGLRIYVPEEDKS